MNPRFRGNDKRMRLHRFYTTETIGSQKEVTIHSDELANQILRVFRMKVGESVLLFDGSGFDYECVITSFGQTDQKLVTFNIGEKAPSRFMPAREVTLCAAVVKKDTFEWILEKATELGVTKIIPVMAERSEKKNLNEERLKKIAIEASEQSGRGTVPEIHPIISLEEALAGVSEESRRGGTSVIAFHVDAEPFRRGSTSAHTKLEIFIGSEGGWSPKEIEVFHANKIPTISLGSQILRSETAVVAALSMVLLGRR
jgi:16S rRNA (uracil1498-N3)-methyltransferase